MSRFTQVALILSLCCFLSDFAFGAFGIGKNSKHRWPNGVIPYVLSPSLDSRTQDLSQSAMAEWTSRTGGVIRFVPRKAEADYVLIQQSTDCMNRSPSIGRQGGKQDLFLAASGCKLSLAVVKHELGHAIGLLHEHQRDDRDKYIVFHPENRKVIPGKEQQSQAQIKVIHEHWDTSLDPTLYGPYDLAYGENGEVTQSIMHYSSADGTNGKGPVFTHISGRLIPNFNQITPGDVRAVREIYSASVGSPAPITLEDRIAQLAKPLVSEQPLPGKALGMLVGVTTQGKHRFFPFGRIRTNGRIPQSTDLWEIGSVTKVFTGLLLAQEALSTSDPNQFLDKPVTELLPEFRRALYQNPHEDNPMKAKITLEQLATHYSGLQSEFSPQDLPKLSTDFPLFFKLLAQSPLSFTPNDQYEYSNNGMSLLGAALSNYRGKSFENLVEGEIAQPLGLSQTGFSPPGVRVPGYLTRNRNRQETLTVAGPIFQPTGGLLSSGSDMLSFLDHLIHPPAGNLGNALRVTKRVRRTRECFGTRTCGIGLGLEAMGIGESRWLKVKTGQTGGTSSVIALLEDVPEESKAGVVIVANDRDVNELSEMATYVMQAIQTEKELERKDAMLAQRDALLAQQTALQRRLQELKAKYDNAVWNAQVHGRNAEEHQRWVARTQNEIAINTNAFWGHLNLVRSHLYFANWCAYYRDWNGFRAHLFLAGAHQNWANFISGYVVPTLRQRIQQHEGLRNQEISIAQGFRNYSNRLASEAQQTSKQLETVVASLEALKSQLLASR